MQRLYYCMDRDEARKKKVELSDAGKNGFIENISDEPKIIIKDGKEIKCTYVVTVHVDQ